MLIVDVVVAAVLAAVSAYFIKVGLGEWRATGTPMSQRSATGRMDPATRAGLERGGVIFGLGLALIALIVAGGGTAQQFRHPSHEATVIVGTLFAVMALAMIACIALGCLIVSFNRPRFLVPPRHRGKPGLLSRRP